MYNMDLTKLSKAALLVECETKGLQQCKSKNKNQLVELLTRGQKAASTPKPILKWVGGKTQIIDKIIAEIPLEMNNYHELFLGGGSVLFAVLALVKSGKITINGGIYAYDLNEPLIYVYKNIQSRHDELYGELQLLIEEFYACENGAINRNPASLYDALQSKENYYYWIRKEYNTLSPEAKKTPLGSAMFIFLNKTCFRGVFRVGPNGFNVPFGNYTNPEIINKEHLDNIHDLIQSVIFECCDFSTSILRAGAFDYVYLDPPYAPETSSSFVGYTEHGFNITQHNKLFKMTKELTEKNIKIMMSNADVGLVRDNFRDYIIQSLVCKRSINSKNPDAKSREVLIKNF